MTSDNPDLGHNKDFHAAERDQIFATYRAGWADVCRAANISPHALGTIDPAVIVAVIMIHLHNRLIDLETRIIQLEGQPALQPLLSIPPNFLKG